MLYLHTSHVTRHTSHVTRHTSSGFTPSHALIPLHFEVMENAVQGAWLQVSLAIHDDNGSAGLGLNENIPTGFTVLLHVGGRLSHMKQGSSCSVGIIQVTCDL